MGQGKRASLYGQRGELAAAAGAIVLAEAGACSKLRDAGGGGGWRCELEAAGCMVHKASQTARCYDDDTVMFLAVSCVLLVQIVVDLVVGRVVIGSGRSSCENIAWYVVGCFRQRFLQGL